MGAVLLALASAFPREALRKDRHQELKEPPNHRVEGNPADVWISLDYRTRNFTSLLPWSGS